ncbi:hypothetical protein CU097_010778, partial [Rhizopus azygosporus]
MATRQEEYEMTRSHSAGSSRDYERQEEEEEEEAQLLDKEDSSSSSSDDEWTVIVDEDQQELPPDNPIMRYVCLGLAIGFGYFVVRMILTLSGHDHTKHREAEKLYHNGSDYFASTVLLISFDGFRPDYLDRHITPNLKKLAEDGVMAKYMHPSYPPSTFPNHWTLVTGLYPEIHGIVSNSFYDPEMGLFQHTDHSATSNHSWWKGEPIWLTSRMHRQRTASIMWPGSETHHNTPDYVVPFNGSMEMKEKMDITLRWLDMEYDQRPQMISIYIPQVDQEGHRGGPNSPKMNKYIQEADDAIGYLTDELSKRNLDSHVHIVVVSDHGMTATTKDKLIYYDDILPANLLKYVRNKSPLSTLEFQPNMTKETIQQVYHQLSKYTHTHHFNVYLRQNMPDRYHYKHSDRIAPIVVIPDIGYTFVTHKMPLEQLGAGDHHGYDNLAEDMRA